MRLLLKDPKYGRALTRMDIRHGIDFDCMTENCPVCTPYREKEKEQWDAMSDKEKESVHFGRIG